MNKEITLTDVLRDYYHVIPSSELTEDKIHIDENLIIEDSSKRYVQDFAIFLNELYYKGYALSGSILKKMMDAIDYEGYESQIINQYISIISKYVVKAEYVDEKFKKLTVSPEEAIKFVAEYCEYISKYEECTIKDLASIPHFLKPSDLENINTQPSYYINLLEEVDDPIKYISNKLLNGSANVSKIIDTAYAIYKTDIRRYATLVLMAKDRIWFTLFLLEEEEYDGLDTLIATMQKSISNLVKLINSYCAYNNILNYQLPEVVIKNINRIIEIMTINITDHQLALTLSGEIDFWRAFNKDISGRIKRIQRALDIYDDDCNHHTMRSPVEYIDIFRMRYPDDVYFYAKYFILNMDYKLLCEHGVNIYAALCIYGDSKRSHELFNEAIEGLRNLNNPEVDNALTKLIIELKEYTTYGEYL